MTIFNKYCGGIFINSYSINTELINGGGDKNNKEIVPLGLFLKKNYKKIENKNFENNNKKNKPKEKIIHKLYKNLEVKSKNS